MRIPEAYEVLEERRINDLNSASVLLKHKKSGARLAVLSNEDENKVFYIGFRTPPADSTGVAHIVEHTVLCGSKNYPVKDPFIELAKGSLNTFLNAMTYPDKTVYPVASCNDQDFRNLMRVYLDAVFYPNIYTEKKIFMQEGWHYEMESADSDLGINGVVYNEMKGAYSSPDDVLSRQILNSLYPDTTYGIESGGDPEVIPELTYEAYLDFHRRYYHPSNSYIYMYGNMDVEERLTFLDEAYLGSFEEIEVDSSIADQEAFDRPRELKFDYPILPEEDEKSKTFLSYNCSVGTSLDPKLTIAFDAIDYALCSSTGAVIKKALTDAGIGHEIFSTWDSGIKQPYFSIVAKDADYEQKDEFLKIINDELDRIVKNGFEKRSLLAALNHGEFKYREADFGRLPKGLIYGLQMLDSWLYDDMLPWIHIESGAVYKELKKEIDTGYFEELTRKYLIDNPHRTVLSLCPKKGLAAEKEEKLKKSLAEYKASLSAEQIEKIVSDTIALKEYQESPDAPEDLANIPLLAREDMKKEADRLIYKKSEIAGVPALLHDVFTNGITYLSFVFDITDLGEELIPYVGALSQLTGYMNTKKRTYGELDDEINILLGDYSTSAGVYPSAVDDSYSLRFEVRTKVLDENLEHAFSLMSEIITSTVYDDPKRLNEIMEESRTRGVSSLSSGGSQTAALRALSGVSRSARVTELLAGIDALRLVEGLCDLVKDSEKAHALAGFFDDLGAMIFRPERMSIDIIHTGAYDVSEEIMRLTEEFKNSLFSGAMRTPGEIPVKTGSGPRGKEAFTTPGQVQYVALAGNFRKHGLEYSGALKALKVMMGYDYLWQNIRVKGGAYGCMSLCKRNGDSYFVTYRDPHVQRSIDVFREAADYIRGFDADERTLTQFIIGAISELDVPKSPSAKGVFASSALAMNVTQEMIQKNRDELLNVTGDDIRKTADIIEAFISDDMLCVVGNAESIKKHADLFDSIEPLSKR